jgi:hypothetical protein
MREIIIKQEMREIGDRDRHILPHISNKCIQEKKTGKSEFTGPIILFYGYDSQPVT